MSDPIDQVENSQDDEAEIAFDDPLVPTDTEFEQRKTEQTLSKRYLVNAPSTGCKLDTLARGRHISWLMEKLQQSSSSHHLDSSRPWLVYWPLHALDLMKALNARMFNQPLPNSKNNNNSNSDNSAIIHSTAATTLGEGLFDWIFRCFTYVEDSEEKSHQKHPIYPKTNSSPVSLKLSKIGGFAGGWHQTPHLASCWAACASLIILCDEIPKLRPKLKDRLDRIALTNWLASLRTKDGGFRMFTHGEVDLRATYCAVCIATVFDLDAREIFPVESLEFIGRCQGLDGGISCNIHGSEGHGGYVSCGFLALILMHCLRENQERRRRTKASSTASSAKKCNNNNQNENYDDTAKSRDSSSIPPPLSSSLLFEKYFVDTRQLRRWCALRQDPCTGGFSGRLNKLVDSCYSWWVGGAMSALALVDAVEDVAGQNNNNNTNNIPPSMMQTMKLRSLSLVQNALMFPEDVTKNILTGLKEVSRRDEVADTNNDEVENEAGDKNDKSSAACGWEDESFDDGGDFAYNQDRLAEYVLELAQTRNGGLCDKPDLCSDLYHSCYSLSGLAVSVGGRSRRGRGSNDQTDARSVIAEELKQILHPVCDDDDESKTKSSNEHDDDITFPIHKLLQEAYQFEKFEATDSLNSTPFQSTHPLLNLTRKRVKFALEFFGGRDSLL